MQYRTKASGHFRLSRKNFMLNVLYEKRYRARDFYVDFMTP